MGTLQSRETGWRMMPHPMAWKTQEEDISRVKTAMRQGAFFELVTEENSNRKVLLEEIKKISTAFSRSVRVLLQDLSNRLK